MMVLGEIPIFHTTMEVISELNTDSYRFLKVGLG
jgi:hypothetical protein